jgi:hypothetical protein
MLILNIVCVMDDSSSSAVMKSPELLRVWVAFVN